MLAFGHGVTSIRPSATGVRVVRKAAAGSDEKSQRRNERV